MANTEMQAATIIGVLGGRFVQFRPRNHSACRSRPRKWPKGYIRTVLSYGASGTHTPRSGINSAASLKRLVKLAMQMVKVSSTICPSS